jgi:hypothetical protein
LRLDPFAPKWFSEQQNAFIKTRNITDGRILRLNRFHFENFWLVEAVNLKWETARTSTPRVFNAVDVWHHCAKMSRQFMRGWDANLGAELRKRKGLILGRIYDLDAVSNSVGLSAEEWLQRYTLEASLMEIYKGEEVFWRQRHTSMP